MSMEQGDALDFYQEVVGEESGPNAPPSQRKEYALEARNGREMKVDITPLDRKFVIDQLNRLPEELLELFSEVDDPEEAQEQANAANALTGLSGEAIGAFETLCSESMDHPELTEHHFEGLASELSLEVLFEIGSYVIEMSLEDDGKIAGFRELN